MTVLIRRVDWLATFTETLMQLQPELDRVRARPIAKQESRQCSGQPPEAAARAYHCRSLQQRADRGAIDAVAARMPQPGAHRPPRGQGVHLTHFRWEPGI